MTNMVKNQIGKEILRRHTETTLRGNMNYTVTSNCLNRHLCVQNMLFIGINVQTHSQRFITRSDHVERFNPNPFFILTFKLTIHLQHHKCMHLTALFQFLEQCTYSTRDWFSVLSYLMLHPSDFNWKLIAKI